MQTFKKIPARLDYMHMVNWIKREKSWSTVKYYCILWWAWSNTCGTATEWVLYIWTLGRPEVGTVVSLFVHSFMGRPLIIFTNYLIVGNERFQMSASNDTNIDKMQCRCKQNSTKQKKCYTLLARHRHLKSPLPSNEVLQSTKFTKIVTGNDL